MKNFTKFLTIAILGMAFSVTTFAQGASATATASATIVTPLALTKTTDMSFGNLSVNATPGTITLPAAAAPVRTRTGGVTLMPGGTVTAAYFALTGLSGATFSVTLPADGAVTLTGPGAPIVANTFTSSATGTLTGGTENFYVGTTLAIAASQTAGVYTSAAFTVTVNYN